MGRWLRSFKPTKRFGNTPNIIESMLVLSNKLIRLLTKGIKTNV